jgi:hypothetical protein
VLKKADGTDQVVISDKVLNNKSVSEFDYGCVNPESIVVKDNHILFFDANNGCWVRDAKNGMFNISQYGISELSKNIGREILYNPTDYTLSGAFDERTNSFMWVVNSPNRNFAIQFDDKRNGWVSFHDYKALPNHYVRLLGSLNNYLLSFIEGDVYVHRSTDYNELFGTLVDTSVTVIANKDLPAVKVWDYIMVDSNEEWTPDEQWDITVDDGTMKSLLKQLKLREGRYVADFKRSVVHPNGNTDINIINTGQRLRGKTIAVTLRNQSQDKVTISTVTIVGTLSEKVI